MIGIILFCLCSSSTVIAGGLRVKRQQQVSGNSILTVEWEGIHSGVPDDKAIGGFVVEYRPETASTFIQHDGLIRYQGPNVKYRVKIRDLPSGMIYFVRIKVIGRNGDVLVQTPEIKAQSETVQIVCDGKLTQPRNIRIVSTTRHSVTYAWEAPECGVVARYVYRVEGYSDWANFDVHTATLGDTQTTVTNLLPGTTYNFRVMAVDSGNKEGPWTDYMVRTTTEGSAPRTSDAIRVLYRTDTQIRVEWEPFTQANVQHYEVVILEQPRDDEAVQVFRSQVPATEHGFLFTNLKPSTNYLVGVIAFADLEPRQLYRTRAATAAAPVQPWSVHPSVSRGIGKFVVQWETPERQFPGQDLKGFIIEYRLPNETTWRRYGRVLEYRPGQREYTTELTGFSDRLVYIVRVYLINTAGEVVAVTDQFTVGGSNTAGSCTGPQGAPVSPEAYYVGPTSVTYSWGRPQCDESNGPVEGYEYSFWSADATEPDRPSFVSTNRVSVDNLISGHRYTFKVRSRSRAGYSPWSALVSASTKPGGSDGNIYKLRIVLATAKSYLVWTPVAQDRGRIDRFRVSYKVSSTENWQRIEEPPQRFQCPSGVGDPGDFCFDLAGLKFGIQYTADVVYRTDNAEWSKQGNPLFFILVEAVQANPEIRQLRVEEQADVVTLKWDVAGPLRRVCCYQVDVRSDREPDWRAYGPKVIQEGDKRYYVSDIRGLPGNTHHFVRVRGMGFTDDTLCTSDAVRIRTHCEPPRSPPENIHIRAVDSRSVVLSWTHPHRSTWGCEDISYVVEGTVGGRPHRVPVPAGPTGLRVEHRLPSEPGAQWRVRVQTVNSAGASPWSAEFTTTTPTEAYVSTPVLTGAGNQLRVDWQSQGHGAGVVLGYLVEHRTGQDPRWQRSGSTVPYRGDNTPYSSSIYGIPQSGATYVRILVLDRNQNVIYTSPEAIWESRCTAPSAPPQNVQIEAPDSRHVRISWRPPPPNTWGCEDIYLELEVVEPRPAPPVRLNPSQTVHVLDARPNERWLVQMRAVNSAGASPWVRTSSVRTPPPGELITGLFVSYPGGVPTLQWMSIDGVGDLVSGYKLEISGEADPTWRSHSSGFIRYVGSQRPYVVVLDDLPAGQRAFVRVQVIDQNNGVAYTSPQVPVLTPSRCRPPITFPRDLTVTPAGPSQIRVTWKPLPPAEWNCDNIWYVIRYTTPAASGLRNFTAGESTAVFPSPPATSWKFEIQSENSAGASAWSPQVSGTTGSAAPGPVEDVRVTQAGPGSVRVTWRPPSNAQSLVQAYDVTYQLLSRGLCGASPEPEVTVTTRDPFYLLQSLHPHSRYRITITARTTVPGVPVSQEITTESAAPTAPPRSLQATDVTDRSAVLTWQAPPCLQTNGEIREYEYEVVGIDSWAAQQSRKSTSPDTRALLDGLTPFTKYSARVRAYTSHGAGPWSNLVLFTTQPSGALSAPPLLRVLSARSDGIDLLWQGVYPPPGDVDRYKVQLAIGGTGRWSEREFTLDRLYCSPDAQRGMQPPTGASLHCVTISGLEPDQNYDFQVSAHVVGRQWGPWSNTASGRTGAGPARVLSVEPVTAGAEFIEIRWVVAPLDQGRVRGFQITVYPLGQPSRIQQFTVGGSVFTYRMDGLEPNTAYNVTVQARTETSGYQQGASAVMRTVDAVLLSPVSPPRVISKTANSVTVEWTTPSVSAGSPIMAYVVEYRTPSTADFTSHGAPVPHDPARPAHTAVVSGLPPNTDVSVRIRNVGKNNQISQPSPPASARTDCMEPSLPPQGIRLDTTGEPLQVMVMWQRPIQTSWRCDQVSYEISYRTSDQPTEQVVRAGSQLSEYSLPSPPYTRWFVKMRTVNRVGASPWSEEVSITTPERAPGRPRNMRLTPLSPNEVLVSWDPPAEKPGVIVGYDVSYRLKHRLACPEEVPQDVSRAWITVYNIKGGEYTLTGLLPYSEYEVKLQARTTELGPDTTKTVHTLQQGPSAPPLDLKSTFVLERGLGFSWQPIECSQRHGPVDTYEYELLGQDDWAKLEVRIANTSQLKLDIDGLTPFTKYIIRVKGYNSAGGGPSTADLEVMTAKADAPLPPQDLTVVSEGHDFIAVSWLPPYPPYGPIDSYTIRYRLVDRRGTEGNWQTAEARVTDPQLRCPGAPAELPRLCFNMTRLESGSQYRIQVAARIEGGSYGPFCSAITANTISALPDAPRSITLLARTSHSLKISWVPPEDPQRLITQYKVTIEPVAATPGTQLQTYMVDAPTTELLMENLEPDTPYNITVLAATARGVGRGIWTSYTTEPALIPIVSTKPIITDIGPSHLRVEWNSVVDPHSVAQGYILQYRKLMEPEFREWGGVVRHDGIKRTYQETITGLEPDTNYVVRIRVVDRSNRLGEPSPQAEARTGCQPPTTPPYDIRAAAESPYEVRVRWVPPPANTWQCSGVLYRIQYRNGTLSPLSHVDLPGGVIEHVFPSAPHTKWTVQLRTQNNAGHSDWSQEIEVTTPETAPGPVTGLQGEPRGPDRIWVTWKPPVDPNGVVRGYVVSYVLKAKGDCPVPPSQPMVKEVHSEKQIIKDLEPASTYEIVVRARTTVVGPPSEPILVTTDETAPSGPPVNVEVTSVHKTGATLTWDEPACEHRNGQINRYEYELEGVDPWARGDTKRSSVTTERAEFTDLLPYTRYKFRVRALNAKGTGPYSEYVDVLTKPGAPPPPRDLRTELAAPTAIQISFLPPSPPHGIIDDYRIRYTPTDRINWFEVRKNPQELACVGVTADSQRLCYRISELEPQKEYAIQVSAHTRDGDWGEWTASLYQPTPEPDIPVPTVAPRLSDRKSDSITVLWEGLDAQAMKHSDGYALEYNTGGTVDWIQHADVIPAKGALSGMIYTETVRGLQPDTPYNFRIRVVSGAKRGLPGPELRTRTLCGKPLQPPRNLKADGYDFNTVRLTWEAPPQSTWRCSRVVYVIKYVNSTHSGQLEIDPTEGRQYHDFRSEPHTRWEFQMRTQALDETGAKGEASDWSTKVEFTSAGPPQSINVDLQPRGPGSVQVTWELPPEFRDWAYGVDVAYRLKQRGNCPPEYGAPITLHNQQSRVIMLENLEPNSVYEVTVTARTPSHMTAAGLQPPKEVKEIRTGTKEPSAAPQNVRVVDVGERSGAFSWDPPPCEKQNGEITQYEYSLSGVDDWAAGDLRQATTSRQHATVLDLLPATRYRLQIRAYTTAGPGPWSEPIEIRTNGSGLGAPRELHPIEVLAHQATVTWLPPVQQRGFIDAYRLKYSARDGGQADEVILRQDQLSCRKQAHAAVTLDSLCHTIPGLRPLVTYTAQVQAKSSTGTWGPWSPAIYFTTPEVTVADGGDLRLVMSEPESLRVRWSPPGNVAHELTSYRVSIADAFERPSVPLQQFDLPSNQVEYTFVNLKPNTIYNVSVEGSTAANRVVWMISKNFQTATRADGCVDWLPAPTDLELLEKTQTSMYLTWAPPEILVPAFMDLFTHYNVTITPFDVATRREVEGRSMSKIVNRPGNRVSFDGLDPATVYNISIQPRTKTSCGETLWGAYSTLPIGATHILRLKWRTPTSLYVAWLPSWGANVDEYVLTATALSGDAYYLEPKVLSVPGHRTEYLIEGLNPATIYNVTLVPRDKTNLAWGAYATLPYGHVFVRNARYCDKKEFDFAGRPMWPVGSYSSIALSWTPPSKQAEASTHYQVRYRKGGTNEWVVGPVRSHYELRCPGDGVSATCERLCYLLYNMTGSVSRQLVQVRVLVDGMWNRWKTVVDSPLTDAATRTPADQACCIVPPPYFVDFVGEEGTTMPVLIRAVPNDTHLARYYVVVDERDPAGEVNPNTLYDKVTAQARNLPYYVGGAFDRHTLPHGHERQFIIGDGEVYGGYLNYPLIKGKKYNWFFIPYWKIGDKPVYGILHQGGSTVSSQYIGGWPWWWLLLFLLLLLLLILLLCCLLWCCLGSRYRRRKRVTTVSREEYPPLLVKSAESKRDVADDLDKLNDRIANLQRSMDTTRVVHTTTTAQGDKGDFEEGYVRGFRDANRLGTGFSPRDRLDTEYAGMKREFQAGYAQGLSDAGRDLSRSMQQLLTRPTSIGGYSAGYMQGFREGSAAMWGDRINMQMLRRLEELYPNQDEFRQGYVDGYKEGLHSRDDGGLSKSLDDISARLKGLESRQLDKGDEIHTTKIYHVYNQLPEAQTGYATSGQQLAHELEELSQSSRRSTLRRHYTPGDYLKYASDTEGGGAGYSSLRRNRRSLSASALGREEGLERARYGADRTSTSRTSVNQYNDTFSRRYNYRSRSDIGAYSTDGLSKRYPSQTILDGVRPGPTAPTHRREALATLQRELDTISRGRGRALTEASRGYSSDTGYVNDTWRGRVGRRADDAAGAAGYDAYQSHSSRTEKHTYSGGGAEQESHSRFQASSGLGSARASPTLVSGGLSSASMVRNIPVQMASAGSGAASSSTITSPAPAGAGASLAQAYNLVGLSGADSSGSEMERGRATAGAAWTDELMDIVNEPMEESLDRMKKYSTSLSKLPPSPAPTSPRQDYRRQPIARDTTTGEAYSAAYKEEYSAGGTGHLP